jgi:molybdopterin/thiamine biosynthesis adenylyltransferase
MRLPFTASRTSIKLLGSSVPGAEDRQRKVPGFDQDVFSKSRVVCVGAGGLISHIAPALARKGIGAITLLDDDVVEPSNLNRQRFYIKDVGTNKALALAKNLQGECIVATKIYGYAMHLEEAIACKIDLACHVAICGVDNNPTRVTTSRYFRSEKVPVIFAAVSRDADHGYVLIQDKAGPCIGCLFPDIVNDDRYPCPGTPAIADILQAVGSLAVYGVDTVLMSRSRYWNYRRISLSDAAHDGSSTLATRDGCSCCGREG